MGGFQIEPFRLQQPNLSNMVIQANQIKQAQRQFKAEAQQRQIKFQQQEFKNGLERMKIFGAIFGAVIPEDPESYANAINQVTTAFGQKEADRILEQLPKDRDRISADDSKRIKTQFRGLIGVLEKKQEQFTLKPGDVRFDPEGEEVARGLPKQPTPTPETKLLNELSGLSANDPRRPMLQAALQKKISTRTTTTEIDPKTGQISIIEGMEAPGLGDKVFKRKIQTELKQAAESLQTLRSIENSFNPDFLTFQSKAAAFGLNISEKLGFRTTPEQRKFIKDESVFARRTVANLNRHIKEKTGAQMSEKEVPRLLGEVPNARLFGDGPTRFKAKMDDVILMAKMSTARLNYIVNSGQRANYGPKLKGIENDFPIIGADGKPDMTMVNIMSEREDALQKTMKLQLPNATQEEIDKQVMDRLSQEFGLIF